MRKTVFILVILPLALAIGSCSTTPGSNLRPAQLQSNYPDLLEKPLSERVGMIPDVLLADLAKTDSTSAYRGYALSSSEEATFKTVLDELPDFLVKPLESEVYAIYFVENFSGGGMTYFVWNHGKPKYVLVFNPRTLHESLSDWLTYRDNTAFSHSGSEYSLRETEDGDHIGFLHTLIHESCHVFDFYHSLSFTADQKLTPVARAVWLDPGRVLPQFDFSIRSRLSFYDFENKPKVPLADFAEAFPSFSHSVFASLYGSWNWLDEFAENETYVLLSQKFGIQVTLELLKNGRVWETSRPSENPRVLERNAAFMKAVKGQ